MVFRLIVLGCWIVFAVYWAVSARSAKSDASRRGAWRGALVRVLIAVAVLAPFRLPGLREWADTPASVNPLVGALGAVCCITGVGIAVWARRHLGANWGMPMTRKADPELVTSGPYARVRHPIYSGAVLALLGSALVSGGPWIVLPFIAGAYFVWSATVEEREMGRRFPEAYPAYARRTKMLVPFVL
jgi:protein-S-isoprenylcysteine O-methyltransferase Ste14